MKKEYTLILLCGHTPCIYLIQEENGFYHIVLYVYFSVDSMLKLEQN